MGRPPVSPSFPQQTRVEARVLALEGELGITEPGGIQGCLRYEHCDSGKHCVF